MTEKIYPFEILQKFAFAVFKKIGCADNEAQLATDVLLSADLRGIDSHGLARLSGYIRLWEANRINAKPNIKIIHESPSTAVVDGDGGLGLVVAPKAMEIAIAKAKQCGTGWVSVQHSNHFGIAGYHAMMALEHDMIGIAMTNASPLVAPTYSVERLLGTNPIAVAIPAGKQPPFVADMATTTAANGKLEILQRKNKEAPAGWIQDKDGKSSTNPHELKEGGALVPLGSDFEHGSHKGYGLGAIVDIFSAVLSGANYAWSGKTPVEGVEDGIVTAYEISQLNLSNTELVVLSACETALGDVKGSEGVFGLQRAFKMAGVKKMIVSLWQVPDKETAELMTSFYTYWMKGKTINDAFAQAQADMRKKYSPFYWAAFVLVE